MRKADGRNGGGPSQPDDTLRMTADATSPAHWTGVGRQECWENFEGGRVPGAVHEEEQTAPDSATRPREAVTTEAGQALPCTGPRGGALVYETSHSESSDELCASHCARCGSEKDTPAGHRTVATQFQRQNRTRNSAGLGSKAGRMSSCCQIAPIKRDNPVSSVLATATNLHLRLKSLVSLRRERHSSKRYT